MLTDINNNRNNFWLYAFTALISTLLILIIMYKQGFHLGIPIDYRHDGLPAGVIVKTFIENGLTFKNPALGAPSIYDFTDYPIPEGAILLILKLFTLATSSFAKVLNLFFLFTFPITAIASLFVFLRLGINKPFSFAASILFCFIPYHFLRIELGHIYLQALYIIPIYVYLMLAILNDAAFLICEHRDQTSKCKYLQCAGMVIASVIAAASGLYYAFFAVYLLFFAGMVASIEKKRWLPIIRAIILIAIISATIFINTLPTFFAKLQHGPNLEIAQRNPAESEFYGLKISQLLFPTDQHHISHLANFKSQYNATAPITNKENTTASLGFIGSIGFCLLILLLVIKNLAANTSTLYNLARLNIAAVLFGTAGGFSSLFAYLLSPMVRCSNRISVFIAFFSLATFFLILQFILKNRFSNRTFWGLSIVLIALGIFDQVPRMPQLIENRIQFDSDKNFVNSIELLMPKNTMIMQLPYVDFPETPDPYDMGSYDQFRTYLHSHQLRWSFGAMKGREGATWQRNVTKKPVKEMLDDLIHAGFTGLYINRKGYADHGQEIETQINTITHLKPALVNDQNYIIFYDLRPYAAMIHH